MRLRECSRKVFMIFSCFTQRLEFEALIENEVKALTGYAPHIEKSWPLFLDRLEKSVESVFIIDSFAMAFDMGAFLKASRGKEAQCLILSKESFPRPYNSFGPEQLEQLLGHIYSLCEKRKDDGYISIPLESLIHFRIVPVDLYIRLSDQRFIKRLPANEEISLDLIKGLQGKGILELFFERKSNREFSAMLINNMINRVEKKYTSSNEKYRALDQVYTTTSEIVKHLGFPKKVVEVCESVIERIFEDTLNVGGELGDYLKCLKDNSEMSLRYRYILITSLVGTEMMKALKLDRPDLIKTFIFATLFCDVSLEDDSLIFLRRPEQAVRLTHRQSEALRGHALRASELVGSSGQGGPRAQRIIREHHGSLEGEVYPQKVSSEIDPLAGVLFVSQEITCELLLGRARTIEEALPKAAFRVAHTHLLRILRLFESVWKEPPKGAA